MSEPRKVIASVTCITEDPSMLSRVVETFARAASGLALEGLFCQINISEAQDDEDDQP